MDNAPLMSSMLALISAHFLGGVGQVPFRPICSRLTHLRIACVSSLRRLSCSFIISLDPCIACAGRISLSKCCMLMTVVRMDSVKSTLSFFHTCIVADSNPLSGGGGGTVGSGTVAM